MYQIKTEKFSGPLALLLQLVEKQNLEITEISLAQVTQDYLFYINDQQLVAPDELADFLVIASTLLLIKSKAILPSLELKTEEKEEIMDLEERLRLYKFYKTQGDNLREIFKKGISCFSRPPWHNLESRFLPPSNVTSQNLTSLFQKILLQLKEEDQPRREEKKIKKIVTLQERIKYLIQKLTRGKKYQLADLVKRKEKKIEVIVTFLALLYLAREDLIKIKQTVNFGEIWISSQK